jgi:hypothetical protein
MTQVCSRSVSPTDDVPCWCRRAGSERMNGAVAGLAADERADDPGVLEERLADR